MKIVNIIHDLFHQPYFVCLLALITCTCFYYLKEANNPSKKIIWIIYFLVFFVVSFIFVSYAIYRIFRPEVWDFVCFYLYGKVAVSGHNFYLPENFHLVFNSLDLPFSDYGNFVPEVLNVGFPYPPPTMLYFVPLGFLSFKTALIVWTVFILLFVFGCLYLINKMFFKNCKLNDFLLVSTLSFILLPSLKTITSLQTNFILLFLLLLMRKYADKKISGIFLTLALFTKPYMAIFGLFFLFRLNWQAIIYFIVSTFILIGVTLVFFGKGPFISYMFDNPLHRLPEYVFHGTVYQSLYAILIRNNLIASETKAIYAYIVAGVLSITGCYLFYLLKRKLCDFMWAVLLLVGLMIYPGMLSHYGVLLLFIVFQFFDKKNQLWVNPYLNIPTIGIFYYLSTFSTFASICFLLLVIILKSFNIFHQVKLTPGRLWNS